MPPLAQEQFTETVIIRLHRRRLSITKLAEELGYARNTVSRTINHPTLHPAVKLAVARKLKIIL